MASPVLNTQSEPPIVEQVITEFFAKSLHIILESRSPYVSSRNYSVDHYLSSPSSSSSSSSSKPRDKWFNLALKDCPAAFENFDIWRQSNLDPLVVDVILKRRSLTQELAPLSPGGCLLPNLSGKDRFSHWPIGQDDAVDAKSDKVVERWIVQYETRNSSSKKSDRELYSGSRKSSGGSSLSLETTLYKRTYRKSVIMLRSLYVLVRLLPAYKLFRELNSSGRISALSLSHRTSSFVEPFTRAEDAEMSQYSFAPIDTPSGRLSLSVSYLPTLEDVSSEPSTPLSTQFIMDYVGSPTTDPLKRFQSLPSAGRLPSQVSVSRRHSWSNDHGSLPSISTSSSPSSDSRAIRGNLNAYQSHPNPPDNFPSASSVPHDVSTTYKKFASFDECWPSPPFSPLSSPSTPTRSPGVPPLLRSESVPLNIPLSRPGKNVGLPNQALPPCPSPRFARPSYYPHNDTVRMQATSAAPAQSAPLGDKLHVKYGNLRSDNTLAKALSFGSSKDEVGNLYGLISTSQCISFPRSSSRLFLLDEFDDKEFACPFADDDDARKSCNRTEFSGDKPQVEENLEEKGLIPVRSPDAVVGALVLMLKSATPLRQEVSCQARVSQSSGEESGNREIEVEPIAKHSASPASGPGVIASGLSKSSTAADALEELRKYKEMKEMILRQGGSISPDIDQVTNSESDNQL